MLITTVAYISSSNLITEKNAPEAETKSTIYENTFGQKNLQYSWLFPEKIPRIIETKTLAVKIIPETRGETPADRGTIIGYIKSFDWDSETVKFIIGCESSWNTRAFNFEEEAKKRWRETGGKSGTPYSSCGLMQVNSAECEKKESPLYDWKYNIDQGYKKFKTQGYGAWFTCKNKLKGGV